MKIANRKIKTLIKWILPIGIFVFLCIVPFCETEVEFEYVGSFTVDTSERGWWGCDWTILKKYGFQDIDWLDELLQSDLVLESDSFSIDPDGVYVYCRGYTLDKITHMGLAILHKLNLEDRYDAHVYLRPDYEHPDQVNLYVLHGDIAVAIERDPHVLSGYTAEWIDGEYIKDGSWVTWHLGG